MSLCVYAIAASNVGRLAVRGLADERLQAVAVGAIAAVVGEVPRIPRPTEEHLRRYDRVIRTLAARGSALLPARYGTQVEDLDELALVLGSREDSLRRQLKAVRHRVQMTVRMTTSPMTSVGRGVRMKTGADYLRLRAQQAAQARSVPQFDPLRAAVRRWVRGERVERRGAVATVYHLVPRRAVDAYRRALERAAQEAGIRVMVSGPWPPYAFAATW